MRYFVSKCTNLHAKLQSLTTFRCIPIRLIMIIVVFACFLESIPVDVLNEAEMFVLDDHDGSRFHMFQ